MTRAKTNLLIGAGGFLAICAAPVLLLPHQPAGEGRIAVVTAAEAAGISWLGVFFVRAFRRADEFHQRREQSTWYWGGVIGLLVSVPVYALVATGGAAGIWPGAPHGREAADAFGHGYMLPVFLQALGAGVASIWWRWSKR